LPTGAGDAPALQLQNCGADVNCPSPRWTLERFNDLTSQKIMFVANDLRRGMAIKYNGNPAIVLEVHHRTPGNKRAFVQAIIRYINTGNSADVRFGSTDKVELVEIDRKKLEFSYKDHNGYHFMDPETYDTVSLGEDLVGQAKDYLVENLAVQVLYAEGRPVQVELPASVNLKVVESPEGVRGDTASNVTKPATLETGKKINVPLFIKEGEMIKIDTRTGEYLGRA
jgi:elongation factor P